MNPVSRNIMNWVILVFFLPNLSAQNVGINQPNPLWPLDISSPQSVARLVTTSSGYGSVLELKNLYASAEYLGAINFNDPASLYPGQIGYKANHSMTFRVGQYERMIIDNQGRLGLGNQAPFYSIDVNFPSAFISLVSTNQVQGSTLLLQNNTSNPNYFGRILFSASGNAGGTISYSSGDYFAFSFAGYERMRITQIGLVGIERIPTTNTLEVSGNASKSSAGDWLANSDARLKKNIKQLNSREMLDKLLMLEGVSYEWNDTITGYKRPDGIQFGFIAQDIQKVFPKLVNEDNEGYLQTAYGTYDPMMVEAIRALSEKVNQLENENAELRSDIVEIKRLVSSTKK